MGLIKKVWLVHDAALSDGSDDYLWNDPAIWGPSAGGNPRSQKESEDYVLAHFCGAIEEGGYSMDQFLRIFSGTGWDSWDRENSLVYDDEASARRDAEKRMAKSRKKYELKHGKKASVESVVERFKGG